jgi:hypothetical protein
VVRDTIFHDWHIHVPCVMHPLLPETPPLCGNLKCLSADRILRQILSCPLEITILPCCLSSIVRINWRVCICLTWESGTLEECVSATSCRPRPPFASRDGEMVYSKPDPCKDSAHDTAKQNVKSVMTIVEPAGRGNEAGDCNRHKGDYKHIDRRGCSTFSN